MTFDDILTQVQEVLRQEGRVAYRILKRRFALNDEDLADLKADLIEAKKLAVDEEGTVLVWVGREEEGETGKRENGETEMASSQVFVVSPQPHGFLIKKGLLFGEIEAT